MILFGGAKRDRTADLLLARQALSQLSYGPECTGVCVVARMRLILADLHLYGGPKWTRTIDLTLIRRAL